MPPPYVGSSDCPYFSVRKSTLSHRGLLSITALTVIFAREVKASFVLVHEDAGGAQPFRTFLGVGHRTGDSLRLDVLSQLKIYFLLGNMLFCDSQINGIIAQRNQRLVAETAVGSAAPRAPRYELKYRTHTLLLVSVLLFSLISEHLLCA